MHGNWGSWNMWSFCSAKCGPGKRERMRKCDNPSPKFGGNSCAGSDRQIMPCSLSDCPGKFSPKIRSCLICCKRGTFFYPILDVEIASHADVFRASLPSAWEANVEVSFWKICFIYNLTSISQPHVIVVWTVVFEEFFGSKNLSIALSRVSGRRRHHGVSSR